MRTLKFDTTIGLILDTTDTIVLLTDLDALASKIEQRLRFFLGEWFLNTQAGIPYFQEIFEKPVDASLIVSLINADIVQEPDVESVQDTSIDYNRDARSFKYNANVVTIYGTSAISTGVTI